jgi:hypothetical protein
VATASLPIDSWPTSIERWFAFKGTSPDLQGVVNAKRADLLGEQRPGPRGRNPTLRPVPNNKSKARQPHMRQPSGFTGGDGRIEATLDFSLRHTLHRARKRPRQIDRQILANSFDVLRRRA